MNIWYIILFYVRQNLIIYGLWYLHTHETQVIAFQRKTQRRYEFAESTNDEWNFIRSDAAFCVGTLEIGRLYFCSFPFVVRIWCCVYGKEWSEYSDVSLHFFNLNPTAWHWQWNLWSSIYLDFRFSYQISSSEEHRRCFMFKKNCIFIVHLSLSNF